MILKILLPLLFFVPSLSARAVTLPEAIEATLKQYPTVIRQAQAVQAAEAARGELWQRFLPATTVTAQEIRTSSFSEGTESHVDKKNLGGLATLSFSPASFFAWQVLDFTLHSAREQSRLLANQLALQTVSAYSAIVFGKKQLNFLTSGFLKTLHSVANDPNVQANPQLSDAVLNLIFSLETQVITQEANLAIAAAQFENLTGLSATGIGATEDLDRLIPVYPSREVALKLAEMSSPTLKSGAYAAEALRHTEKTILPSYFTPNLSFLPSQAATVTNQAASITTHTGILTAGIAVNVDVFGYARGKKVAHLNYEQSLQTQTYNERMLSLQINTDYIRYRQQSKTLCNLRPQSARITASFNRLIHDIDAGLPYNPGIVLTAVSQAVATIAQLYTAETVSISAVSDIHAQIGDLSEPSSWDTSQIPSNETLCREVTRIHP